MVQDRGSGSRDGVAAAPGRSGGGGSRQALKKGPWTAAEDSILTEYVRKHGEGNWNTVQKNSGLLRCGKSCRLRWANHLRPNLKKGAFSAEEERLIIELHAKLGNKWARMASQLPGRTDNEIKNYWNTRVKRRLRAGLPIYPPDIQQHHHHHHHPPTPPPQPQPPHDQTQPNPSSSPLSSLFPPPSSVLSEPSFNPSLSFSDHINFPKMANPPHPHPIFSFLSNPNYQFKLFRDNTNGGFATPMSSYYSSPQFHSGELLPAAPLVQFNSGDFGTTQTAAVAASPDLIGSAPSRNRELPSIQSTVPLTPPTSSGNTGSDYTAAASSNAEEYEMVPELSLANSGLLEALLEESQALTKPKKQKLSTCDKGVREKEALEEMSCIDDDLSCLLDNFPLTLPVPNWYDGSGNV